MGKQAALSEAWGWLIWGTIIAFGMIVLAIVINSLASGPSWMPFA